jgi:AAA+ superfamily predicted ATPase
LFFDGFEPNSDHCVMNEQRTSNRHMISNALNLQHSLDFLGKVFSARIRLRFGKNRDETAEDPKSLELAYYNDGSALANFITSVKPSFEEYVILLLALAPHVRPNFLDTVIKTALPEAGDFPEIGGTRDKENRGFLPTGETALFLLAGDDFAKRFEVQRILTGDHWFARNNILRIEPAREGEPFWSGRLLLNRDYIEMFTLGRISAPPFSAEFPAQEIRTDLNWEDLVLNEDVLAQIEDIKGWIQYNAILLNDLGMAKKIRPGYRALFHGSPGTGKTLTATLLGKYTDRQVFRIDLSTVVSKFIGETEKNLASLFDRAKNREWILFFDEADALFGKRTSVKDSHDRYANQEVSYLLQRVEEFDGLIILASNFKANLDESFLRRFNAIIRFPFPRESERVMIWRKSFPENMQFENNLDLPEMLGRFELTGGSIINVVHHACLKMLARGPERTIRIEDVLQGIRREVEKEGKVFKNILNDQPQS